MNKDVAIDGPAGAGKSTIAKLVGNRFNLMYINTGAMYRTITYYAQLKKIEPSDKEGLRNLINSLNIHFEGDSIIVNGENITNQIYMPEISKIVSAYSAIQVVREMLVFQQKEISKKYDVIMDGRDIGSVVLKNAKYKFFITASAEVRANRRYKELCDKKIEVSYDSILADINTRDYLDSHRELSPLVKAEDAISIDTSNMNIEEVVNTISRFIR